ncbi:MAG TPA: TadE family protein [Solirubrobacteraceae bacterium]|nr:TadE family protein [Solirubrobacteraceae bacterium]
MRADRFRRREGGQSLVEFALVLPIFLLLTLGLFEAGRAVWYTNTLAYAAREGTRYAIVHGSASGADAVWPGNEQPVKDVVRAAAVGVVGQIDVETDWPDFRGPTACYERSCRVSVEVTSVFTPLPSEYLLGGAFRVTLRGGSMLVIQR